MRESRSGPIPGRTRDVSDKGLCLETNTVIREGVHILAEAMEVEKRLLLTVEIPESEYPVDALGQVIWYDLAPTDSDFRFRAGVLFTELEEDVRKTWHRFIAAVKKRKFS